jgi:hypothetical protein
MGDWMSKKNQKIKESEVEKIEEVSAEEVGSSEVLDSVEVETQPEVEVEQGSDNAEEQVQQEPNEPVQQEPVTTPSAPEDLNELSARRKRVVIDLKEARKDDEGHEFAKKLEKELEDIDLKISTLKESELRKKEKAQLKEEIGRPILTAPASKIQSPKSAGGVGDSQIPALFKLKVRAPTSIAFDLVKICDIMEEAAYDLYFAHNGSSPIIQAGIQYLAKLNEELCEALMEAEVERLEKEKSK